MTPNEEVYVLAILLIAFFFAFLMGYLFGERVHEKEKQK